MNKNIIIAGGGTGGHIFPAIAVANALKQLDSSIEILFIGATGKMEMEKVPQAGYKIMNIDIAGFNRTSLLKNISLPFKLLKSFGQVRSILNSFKPNAVFGVGGYSSYPVLKLAQAKRIPTFLHESNAFAGKSNILLGKNAKKVFVAADGMSKFFPAEKIIITGNPVRKTIAECTLDSNSAKAAFGLEPEKLTVLAMGGSLGAKSINEAIEAGLSTIVGNNLQLIWQTGKPYAERAKNAAANNSAIWTNDFITSMETAYAAADIVVSRSGAMSVAELCVVGKPVIFVPYPFAAEDHQTANAKMLADSNSGILIKDADVKNNLLQELINLSNNITKQKTFSANIKLRAVTNADIKIAEQILMNI